MSLFSILLAPPLPLRHPVIRCPPITIKSVMLIHPFSILHQVNLRPTQLTYHIGLWLALYLLKQQYKIPDTHAGLSKLIILGPIPVRNQKAKDDGPVLCVACGFLLVCHNNRHGVCPKK
ncbi:MAG: hypothetical protein M3M88_04680 [Thermoproteota archaeon]|nr:hypothetical protein [Thermoproteota archaeon]